MFLPSVGGKHKEVIENWLSQAKAFVSQYARFIWTVGRNLVVIFFLCALSILLLSKAFFMPPIPLNKLETVALTSLYAVNFYQFLLSQIPSWPESMPFNGANIHFDEGYIQIFVSLMASVLVFIVVIMMIYAVRHVLFTLNRLFGNQRHPYLDIDCARWPLVTVFIAAHNEEKVIEGCLKALLNSNYPVSALRIVPVNDRSSDGTRDIIDQYVSQFPGRITPFHRTSGKPGKAAALKDALVHAHGDLAIIFDADYIPGRGLLKQLIAPFFDPEVGAVMGRVVPINAGVNLLTRMLDLERSGGYQVDQQARMNLKLVPQYGGTVGGVRLSAVEASGGWHDNVLAEDTDITYRLLINGWKTIYTNRSECYEEVPEDWAVRIKQVKRWAKGHNQVLVRYWYSFIKSDYLSLRERVDGLLLLFVFVMPPLLLLGWFLAVALYFLNAGSLVSALIPVFALLAYGTMGNFAAFFEITIAVLLDGNRRRILLLPFNLLGFFISLFAISSSVTSLIGDHLFKRDMVWEKTIRYRKA
ncbi:glycosyltransferase [Undibacterium jejuense]